MNEIMYGQVYLKKIGAISTLHKECNAIVKTVKTMATKKTAKFANTQIEYWQKKPLILIAGFFVLGLFIASDGFAACVCKDGFNKCTTTAGNTIEFCSVTFNDCNTKCAEYANFDMNACRSDCKDVNSNAMQICKDTYATAKSKCEGDYNDKSCKMKEWQTCKNEYDQTNTGCLNIANADLKSCTGAKISCKASCRSKRGSKNIEFVSMNNK